MIQSLGKGSSFFGVKLSPSLVEHHPADDGRAVVQMTDGGLTLTIPLGVAGRVHATGTFDTVIGAIGSEGKDGRAIAQVEHIVGRTTVGDVLPYQHAQSVAVVVPAQRLQLAMLAQHVKASILHSLDVVDIGLIAGGSQQTVGPVALIQQTVLEVRLVI